MFVSENELIFSKFEKQLVLSLMNEVQFRWLRQLVSIT